MIRYLTILAVGLFCTPASAQTLQWTIDPIATTPPNVGSAKIIDKGVDANGAMHFDVVLTPTACSADGTLINAPNGSLSTNAGKDVWTWGAKGTTDYAILLNGTTGNAGRGVTMEVAHGCVLYVKNGSTWYKWSDATQKWSGSVAP